MKFFSTIIFFLFFYTATSAGVIREKFKIGSNAKTSTLEIKFNSTYKKNLPANFIIFNEEGKRVSAFQCEIIKGSNVVCLQDALNLKEGIYTVEMTLKKRKSSTKFVLFK